MPLVDVKIKTCLRVCCRPLPKKKLSPVTVCLLLANNPITREFTACETSRYILSISTDNACGSSGNVREVLRNET